LATTSISCRVPWVTDFCLGERRANWLQRRSKGKLSALTSSRGSGTVHSPAAG
jgi:hypothetical protein